MGTSFYFKLLTPVIYCEWNVKWIVGYSAQDTVASKVGQPESLQKSAWLLLLDTAGLSDKRTIKIIQLLANLHV